MKDKIIIGCDISKNKIDFYCGLTEEYFLITNDASGFEKLKQWLDQHQFDYEQVYFSMEHTGYYLIRFTEFLLKQGIAYFVEPALEIKRSMGITRGKSDTIDANRIYAFTVEKFYKLSPKKPTEQAIQLLKRFNTNRALLVSQRASLITTCNEQIQTMDLLKDDFIAKQLKALIKIYDKQIKDTEMQIESIIAKSNKLTTTRNLLESIIGVGKVISTSMIIATENFTRFKNWRQFASYCGCAPFPNESGKTKRPSRVSKLANKRIKSYLSQGAASAIQYDPELKSYYERKVLDGKLPGRVLNAVKCKLIARMFSVINRQSEFKRNYSNNLAISRS